MYYVLHTLKKLNYEIFYLIFVKFILKNSTVNRVELKRGSI